MHPDSTIISSLLAMQGMMQLGLLFMQQSNSHFEEKTNAWLLRLFHLLDHGETLIRLINHFSCCSTSGSAEMRDNSTRLSSLFHRPAKTQSLKWRNLENKMVAIIDSCQ